MDVGRPGEHVLLVDGHVHIYARGLLAPVLRAAAANFARRVPVGASWEGLLLLADPAGVDSASLLGGDPCRPFDEWRCSVLEAPHHYRFVNGAGIALRILRGTQLTSSEGLEVLSIGPSAERFSGPAARIVESIAAAGNLVILPWGVGKWWGRRGEVVRAVLDGSAGKRLLLGDNGGRPWFWPESPLFKLARTRGVAVLPGSDPLPLAGDERRVGSMGARLDLDRSWADWQEGLCSAGWHVFGSRMGAWRFLRNQVGLRMARRARSGRSGRSDAGSGQ